MTQTNPTHQRQDENQPSALLIPLSDLTGYRILTDEEDLGKIDDILIEDRNWRIRYLVVNIGNWLTGRKVVLDTAAFDVPDPENRIVCSDLPRARIEKGPTLAEHEPISLKHRRAVAEYYGWPGYWNTGFGGVVPPTAPLAAPDPSTEKRVAEPEEAVRDDLTNQESLRSFNEIKGYSVEATDDSIGHIEDMVTDPADWMVRYFVVDTRNWFPGKKVIIGIDWLSSVSYPVRTAYVNLKRDQIKSAPEYAPEKPISRAYEKELHDHYGLPTYWV